MEWVKQFDELKSSALKELANIGISHVATAIGEIANEKVDISLPEMGNFSKEHFIGMDNRNGNNAVAYFTVDGISDLTEIIILLPKEDAFGLMNSFINISTPEKIDVKNLSLEDQASIFSEVSTVIAATYFSAVNSMFNLKTNCDIPQTSFGAAAVKEFLNAKLRKNEAITINASFTSVKSKLQGQFLLIPDPQTLSLFFKSIGLEV